MKLNSVTFDKYRLKCLNTQTMQGRSAIQKNVFPSNNFFKNCPNFWYSIFNKTTGTGDVIRELTPQKFRNNKWFEEFQGHMLRQTALMKLQLRTNHNNRTTRIVHAFTQK